MGPLPPAEWTAWFGAVNDRATALQCMEMLGGGERVLDDVVAYIKDRLVFGQPVGSFQAAQHHVANLGISLSAARVACYAALCRAAVDDADVRREVSIAKSWLSKAYKEVTVMAHQLFGAIGYVRETDLHLWSQRAKTAEAFFGDRTYHLRRLADLTLGEVSGVAG
jgi:3-oxocholest-4-en-26-oyl-CoA dehydrogenase beta subunit